jgi:hypothetical protein
MRRRVPSAVGWIAGWIVNPAVAWGLLTGIGAAIWAGLAGLPAVIVALVALASVTLVVVLAHYGLALRDRLRTASTKHKGWSPAERRERLDYRLYPPRDDRLELGEQCANFATKMQIFNEEEEWRRERTIGRFAEEAREADPDLDPQQAREEAEAVFERKVKARYGFKMREEALRLFDGAREKDAIAAKMRRMIEGPRPVEMSKIPHLFNAIARRLSYEPLVNYSSALGPPPEDLRGLVDALMREGISLVAELSAPVEPQRTDGGWRLDGGGAPDEWWNKADDFAKRIRQLLIDRHPALLTDYRDGYNAHVRKERRERKKDNAAEDTRSTPEKMLDFANFERSGPRRVVEASLEGLAASRRRLAGEQTPKTI